MLSNEFLLELHKLNRSEKLQVVQILVNEMAMGEEGLIPDKHYEVWLPIEAPGVAAMLEQMLEESKTPHVAK